MKMKNSWQNSRINVTKYSQTCLALGSDYQYPLRQSIHEYMFYTFRCV